MIKKIAGIITNNLLLRVPQPMIRADVWDMAKQILNLPFLALVDRKAKLPELSKGLHLTQDRPSDYSLGQKDMQQTLVKQGWVKEIKE